MTSQTPDGSTPPRNRLRGSLADRLEVLLPIVGYAAVVLSGATTSSLGAGPLRQDPTHPMGTLWGTPNGVRSDEWLTQTPIELNVLSLGHSSSSPLAEAPDLIFQVASGQPVESLFFFDSTLLRLGPWLPDAMLFAAWRALPLLALLLMLPPLLRRFGANRPMSWLAVALVVLAPTTLWWSFTPVRILAFASAGSYLLVLARDRLLTGSPRWGRAAAVALTVLGGLLIARLGTYYVPWSLTIGLPLVLATAAWLVWSSPRRPGLIVLAGGAVAGGLLLGATFWENLTAVQAGLDTAYPGTRRSAAAAMPPFHLFGAPGLYRLQDPTVAAIPNQSEIASAYLVCLAWAGLLFPGLMARLRQPDFRGQRAALTALAGVTTFWLLWCVVSWGPWSSSIPLVSLVSAPRAAQTVGYGAALVLCIVVSQAATPRGYHLLAVAGLCGLVTAYGVSTLQSAVPTLGSWPVWLSAFGCGAVVWLVTRFPSHWAPVALVVAVLLVGGYKINPVNFGLGDLRASPSAGFARHLGALAREKDGSIAADSEFVSALLVANGAPTLTGYQTSGPDIDRWNLLDPDGRYEESWNRGASYLRMTFDGKPGADPVMTNPNPDIIQVSVDPCELGVDGLEVSYVVSQADLTNDCLRPAGRFTWSGVPNYVFEVRGER